jgi:tetratricopeptide (TPR) repeat protein
LSAIVTKEKRNLIPRWRSFRETLALGELAAPPKELTTPPSDGQLQRRMWEWSQNRTVWHAADLVGAAFILRQPEVARDAADFLLSADDAPSAAKSLARRLQDQKVAGPFAEVVAAVEDFKAIYSAIHLARERLQDDPRNAIQWIDLARQYTSLGLDNRARRAVGVAISLNKNNRFILRAAARFYVHQGEVDHAHELVRRAPATPFDPWLLSAELALAAAAEVPPRFAHTGRKLLGDASMNPLSLTELAGELGTLELSNGKVRNAKKLFRQSLANPNENSVAQAEWAWQQVTGHQLNVNEFRVPYNFEAQAWHSFEQGLWENALENSQRWLLDQPFSRRPAILGSYVASILEEYKTGIDLLERSLIPNPNDPILLNNIAFAYANTGQIKEAQDALNRTNTLKPTPSDQVCLYATQGLVYFRQGLVANGIDFYKKALELAASHKLARWYAMALLNLALEEIRAHCKGSEQTADMAAEAAEGFTDVSIQVLARRLTQKRHEPVL